MSKPTINVWYHNQLKRIAFYYTLIHEIKDNNTLDITLDILIDVYFFQPLKFVYFFNKKKIHNDIIDLDQINWIVMPCISFESILDVIKTTINKEIYNFCVETNAKIIISYIREYVVDKERDYIYSLIQKHIISNGWNSDFIKIINNGFLENIDQKHSNLFVNVNIFDKLMRFFIENETVKREYEFIQKRKYDFSLLTGTLIDRIERVFLFLQCDKNNLIDDRFFYSLICLDKNKVLSFINKKILSKRVIERIKIRSFFDKILEHKVYKENGEKYDSNECIYGNQHEFKIPHQVVDSYINIVLETRPSDASLTEKIYKPIIAGVPFIWLAHKNVLPYLESQGYKRYDFINYEFDSFDTVEDRLNELVKEMVRLKTIDLEKAVLESKHISEHNKNNFYKTTERFDELLINLNEPIPTNI